MPKFMKTCSVIVYLFAEYRLRRHLNIVARRHVEGLVAADPEIRAGRHDQRLGMGNDLALGQGHRIVGEAGTQAFALREVEQSVALEEGNCLCLVAAPAGARLLGLGNEAVGEDDGGARLALADIAPPPPRPA